MEEEVTTQEKRLYTSIGRNVRHYRKAKSLSQTQLAQLLATSQPRVAAIEAGSLKNLTTEYLIRLAQILGVRAEHLTRFRREENV